MTESFSSSSTAPATDAGMAQLAAQLGKLLAAVTAQGTPLHSGDAIGVTSLPAGLASDASLQSLLSALQGTLTTKPTSGTVTQMVLTGTGGTLAVANASRKWLRWMNVGAVDVTVAPGTAQPVVGQGMVYQANSAGVGRQGSADALSDTVVATNAFSYSASAAATIVVWECS